MKITADTHLTPHIWASRSEVYGDAYAGLHRLELDSPAEDVILAGDIFNSPFPDGDSLYEFSRFCKAVHDRGGKIYAVQGNHDKSTVPLFKSYDVIQLGKTPVVTSEGFRLCGLDWMPTQQLQKELSEIPECDFLVMHSPFRHMLGFDGKWQLEMKDIPEHIKHVVSGDIHKLNISVMTPNKLFISPGSTRLNSLSELHQAHGYVTYRRSGGALTVDHVPYEPRMFKFAKDEPEAEGMLQEVRNGSTGKLKPVLFVPEKMLGNYTKVQDVIVLPYNDTAAKQAQEELQADSGREISLAGFLPDVVNKELEPELYSFIEGALAVHPDGLQKYLDDWLKTRGV